MDATNWLHLTSKTKRNYHLNSQSTFSIIFTLCRPQTVESCLVIISFFLPGDCLGGVLEGAAGGSVEISRELPVEKSKLCNIFIWHELAYLNRHHSSHLNL